MQISNSFYRSLLLLSSTLLLTVSGQALAQSGPAVGQWALSQPASNENSWFALNDIERVATSLDTNINSLGNGWYFAENDTYYYMGFWPFIYDQTLDAWFYLQTDGSGAYYYNYTFEGWFWFPRDGSGAIPLP